MEKQKKSRFDILGSYVITGLFSFVAGVLTGTAGFQYEEYTKHHSELVNKLTPKIEFHDKKPGISFEDQINLAQRADILTSKIREGQILTLEELSVDQLEKVARSYHME